jgi:hypothetical protein
MAKAGKGKPAFLQGPATTPVMKGKSVSAGSKTDSGNTGAPVPGKTVFPTKAQKSPTGNKKMSPAGKNAHSGIAKGPGKPGKTK